ncbi:MAG: uracil phosphoribosyltransferase [Caldisericaceae bacterium]
MEKNVTVIDHPLIQHKLTLLRKRETDPKEFRELVRELSGLMAYEIFRNIKVKDISIETPVGPAIGKIIDGDVAVVPILRAGIIMEEGILQIIPNAKVGHIGIYRDPETLQPVEYYCKLPANLDGASVFIVDPMLATGGSAVKAIELVKEVHPASIDFVCLISAPPGIEKIQSSYPDVNIYTLAIDPILNSHGYIVPGLGDAGDRLFGTR